MLTRPFRDGETDHCPSAGQVILQLLRLPLHEQIVLGVADQCGATDRLGDATLQIVPVGGGEWEAIYRVLGDAVRDFRGAAT
jgi:hypothetical protein